MNMMLKKLSSKKLNMKANILAVVENNDDVNKINTFKTEMTLSQSYYHKCAKPYLVSRILWKYREHWMLTLSTNTGIMSGTL